MSPLALLLLLLASHSQARLLDLIDLDPRPDLSASVCHLTDISEVTSNLVLVPSTATLPPSFLLQAAQLLAPEGYRVCTLQSGDSLPAEISIVEGGHPVRPYFGRRDGLSLLRFVQRMSYDSSDEAVHVIGSKAEKKAFEQSLAPKVVAYFPDPTAPAFADFQVAARHFASKPQFYVVHDPQIAAKLRLQQPGQVALIRRLEKATLFFEPPSSLAQSPSEALISWVKGNRGLVLHRLDDSNLHDPELADPGKYHLVAVADKTSSLGLYFYKILAKTIQNVTRHNQLIMSPTPAEQGDEGEESAQAAPGALPVSLDDLKVVWVDLKDYPSAGSKLRRESVRASRGVWFGLVDSPLSAPVSPLPAWFDLDSLNATCSSKTCDEANIATLRHWILSVTNRLPPADQTPLPAQSFLLQPESVVVREGASFVLDCKVSHKSGQCGWTRDDLPVPVGVAPYKWLQEGDPVDCSLSVSDAHSARDSGQWKCLAPPSLESLPASVSVRTPHKPEL